MECEVKPENPKDKIGVSKAPKMSLLPSNALMLVSLALEEGARKYGAGNWRKHKIIDSVYFDAVQRHLHFHREGETIDEESGLPHIVKACAALLVWIDAWDNNRCHDDRPIAIDVKQLRDYLQQKSVRLADKYPNPRPPFTERKNA